MAQLEIRLKLHYFIKKQGVNKTYATFAIYCDIRKLTFSKQGIQITTAYPNFTQWIPQYTVYSTHSGHSVCLLEARRLSINRLF